MTKKMGIGDFLPLARMAETKAHETYLNAKPFPHVVLDNFFSPELLDEVLEEFPAPGQIKWEKFDNAR